MNKTAPGGQTEMSKERLNHSESPFPEKDSVEKNTSRELKNNLDISDEERQLAALEEEKKQNKKAIRNHVGLACGIAVAPLPGADAVFLIGNEIKMFDNILENYDMKKDLSATMLIKKMGIKVGVTRAGKKIASSLLQLFPGVGTAINAGVAMAMTYAVGLAISEMCYKIKKAKITGDEEQLSKLQDNMENIAKEVYEKKYDEAKKEFDEAPEPGEMEEEYVAAT